MRHPQIIPLSGHNHYQIIRDWIAVVTDFEAALTYLDAFAVIGTSWHRQETPRGGVETARGTDMTKARLADTLRDAVASNVQLHPEHPARTSQDSSLVLGNPKQR